MTQIPSAYHPPPTRIPSPTPTSPGRYALHLVCTHCERGYWTGAPAPLPPPCPACATGRLVLLRTWDLATQGRPGEEVAQCVTA
jgi:hypothetical protein